MRKTNNMIDSMVLSEEVLRERAREYSRHIVENPDDDQQVFGTVFRLGGEFYMIEMQYMDEIMRSVRITGLPQANRMIAGIANVRGDLRLVLDLRVMLALKSDDANDGSRMLMLRSRGVITAVIVDEVCDVAELDRGSLKPPIISINAEHKGYTKGIFLYKDKQVVWLDADKILIELEKRLTHKGDGG